MESLRKAIWIEIVV